MSEGSFCSNYLVTRNLERQSCTIMLDFVVDHRCVLLFEKWIRDAHVKPLTCWKFLTIFHWSSFLPRHFFLCVVWSWINVRYIPLSLEDLWETSTESFEHTENFLGNFKVRTLAQVSQNKFLPLTELPDLGRFSKNPMRRRFYRAISFLCVVWSWINVR